MFSRRRQAVLRRRTSQSESEAGTLTRRGCHTPLADARRTADARWHRRKRRHQLSDVRQYGTGAVWRPPRYNAIVGRQCIELYGKLVEYSGSSILTILSQHVICHLRPKPFARVYGGCRVTSVAVPPTDGVWHHNTGAVWRSSRCDAINWQIGHRTLWRACRILTGIYFDFTEPTHRLRSGFGADLYSNIDRLSCGATPISNAFVAW